ncbi:inorganic triphosphatase [Proteus terrae]|uniref:CYTH domain-containing protein n=1 Tax=Proteus terrae TaxID=1574161 RepID=UPI0018C5B9A1|nr:CYTH domain-containing protein [Proteus terrae]MBG2838507.1 CYTH domain-containing protein [Proteus terrae subsp. cibarius]MBG2869371.1 CYTH domain-containing protein [Proteus terrae subsp. cibarius]
MSQLEIELKMSAIPAAIPHIIQRILTLPHQHSAPKKLTNLYFETTDNQIRRWDMGLRIRGVDESYEMTIKTAGKVVAGLHQRPEYNVKLEQPKLDLARFPAEIWPENTDLTLLETQLNVLFNTDFYREIWLVDFQNSQIEVVLDKGTIRAHQYELPIEEFELELKKGDVSDIIALATYLGEKGGLRLASRSKAARGYYLAKDKPALSLSVVNLSPSDTTAQQLTKWLSAIQALEEAIFANPTPPTITMPAMLALFSDWCKKQSDLPESMQQSLNGISPLTFTTATDYYHVLWLNFKLSSMAWLLSIA